MFSLPKMGISTKICSNVLNIVSIQFDNTESIFLFVKTIDYNKIIISSFFLSEVYNLRSLLE